MMVSTRGNADETPSSKSRSRSARSPASSSRKRSSSTRASRPTSPTSAATPKSPSARSPSTTRRRAPSSSRAYGWAHTPSQLLLAWLAISVPFVIWDTGYVLGRPYTLPGGKWHWPLYQPYKLYGQIDYMYSPQAYALGIGFTGAQAAMNVIETIGYIAYFYLVFTRGTLARAKGRGAPPKSVLDSVPVLKELAKARVLRGSDGAIAALLIFSTALMTLSKTVLYLFNEYYSGLPILKSNIFDIILLFVIPDGLWIVFPAYITYTFGKEVLQGLRVAAAPRRE